MKEIQKLYLPSLRGTKIPALFARPDAETYPVVLAAHGYSSSKSEYGLYDQLAQRLAERGIASLRIDFPGCGESRESFLNYTFENMLDDMETAFSFLRVQEGADLRRKALQGYSMGGCMAALFWKRHPDFQVMSCWAPGWFNGPDFAWSFAGGGEDAMKTVRQGKESGVVRQKDEWGVHEMGYPFFEQAMRVYPLEILTHFDGDLFVACGDSDHIIPLRTIETGVFCASRARSCEVAILPGADHDFGTGWRERQRPHPETAETLLDRTLDFLCHSLR